MDYIIKQGESIALEIAVYDEDNNSVDLSLADDIRVLFNIKGVVGAKFTLVPEAGYETLQVKSAPDNHILICELTRDVSKSLATGFITAHISTKTPDGILTEGKYDEYTVELGQVVQGYTKDELF